MSTQTALSHNTGRLYISETFVNETKHVRFGETEPYEVFTADRGKLFKSLQKEYGRCISCVYQDTASGGAKAIGWVFSKRMKYEGATGNEPSDYYIREVWVTLHTELPTKTVEYHYAEVTA